MVLLLVQSFHHSPAIAMWMKQKVAITYYVNILCQLCIYIAKGRLICYVIFYVLQAIYLGFLIVMVFLGSVVINAWKMKASWFDLISS